MKTFRSLLFLFVTATAALGQGVTATWVAPIDAVSAGNDVVIEFLAINRSAGPQAITLPERASGQLVTRGQRWPVLLNRSPGDAAATIPGGAFQSRLFTLSLPEAAEGRAVLEIEGPFPGRVVLEVLPGSRPGAANVAAASLPASVEESAATTAVPPLPTTIGLQPAISRVQRAFADRFSEHLPVYFIYGPDDPVAKFQFSFKYRLFGDRPDGGENGPVLSGLHFGYTQRSLWDIQGSSSPFYDSSYMPELVFESLAPDSVNPDGWLHWLGLQAGFQHESNGRDGPGSRSLNIVYVRPVLMIGRFDGWNLILAPRVFAYVGGLDDNEDLRDYRGNAEFVAVFGKNNSLAIAATARFGDDFENGSVEVNVTYPVRFSFGNFASFFLVQYFEGYGESLLNYNQRSSTVRAGFSFVR